MRVAIFAFVIVGLIGCATSKQSSRNVSPVGNWDYTVKGTPEGDFAGVMVVASTGKVFSAKLSTGQNELPIEKFVYDEASKKMTGEFYYSSARVYFNAQLSGDAIDGTMSVDDASFPFKATRKK